VTRAVDSRQYLVEAKLLRDRVPDFDEYPFNLPATRNLDIIEFTTAVTFLIGENGSGKSTLIEAIAIAWGFNAEGGSRNLRFTTRSAHSDLHQFLRLTRSPRKPHDGYFLRAESFFNVASEIDRLDKEPGSSPPIINSYGGTSLHAMSHGESFFTLLIERFGGRGLYVLDEPEAALSPMRQLAALARIHQLVSDDSQFVIATHSPILMAYPGARILQLEGHGIVEIAYEETEHYSVTREFLNHREALLEELFAPE
jgi:predicted ATPase